MANDGARRRHQVGMERELSETLGESGAGSVFSGYVAKRISRRNFLKMSGAGLATVALASVAGTAALGKDGNQATRPVILANALGLVVGDPTRCVGCRRCELACTEFNDGKSQPAIARIKVGRNYNFGPRGVQVGFWRGEGNYGNGRIIQDTCKQCPHPVPCATACPRGAIEVVAPVNARVVNLDKCTGCGICAQACPWEMIAVDPEIHKATKCFLCKGDPECVKACPTGALSYIKWRDLTKNVPIRQGGVPFTVGRNMQEVCGPCHQ